MKRQTKLVLSVALAASLLSLRLIGAQVSPLTVINTLVELLTKKPATGESVLVLGQSAIFDSPIRLARHFTNEVYPIDNITAYSAVGGGEWYLVDLSSGTNSSSSAITTLTLACGDGSNHDLTIVRDILSGVYSLQIDQSSSGSSPTTNLLQHSDATTHELLIAKDSLTGVYSWSLDQADSGGSPSTITFSYSNGTLHTLSVAKDGLTGYYSIAISQ